MPQMSSMMWLYLFIYFITIYLIIMIMIYNLYTYDIMNFFQKYGKYINKNYINMKVIFFLKW